MSEKRRLLFVINSMEGGGAERVMSILLGHFAKAAKGKGASVFAGAELHLALLDRCEEKYPLPSDIEKHTLDSGGSFLKSIFQTASLVSDLDPDLTFSFLTRANCACILSALAYGHKCVISERVNTTSHFGAGLGAMVNRKIVRTLYPRADRVLAPSEGVREDLVQNYGVSADRLNVIHNPYELETIRASGAAAAAFTPPNGRPYIVSVGRLNPNKNFPLLLKAYAKANPQADLVILGEGPQREELQSLAEKLRVSERVHFPGFVDNPYPSVAGAALYVCPSNAEGFPNALAEAMVLGRAVVSTDCPSGPAELLKGRAPKGGGFVEAEHGLITPVNDSAAMGAALSKMDDPQYRDHMAALSAARMQDFRAEVIAAQYEAAINRVFEQSAHDR